MSLWVETPQQLGDVICGNAATLAAMSAHLSLSFYARNDASIVDFVVTFPRQAVIELFSSPHEIFSHYYLFSLNKPKFPAQSWVSLSLW